jgi:peptidoglycan/xylan/chitin deacetylase (PgdA/CDA1 family)/LysM repeat protein
MHVGRTTIGVIAGLAVAGAIATVAITRRRDDDGADVVEPLPAPSPTPTPTPSTTTTTTTAPPEPVVEPVPVPDLVPAPPIPAEAPASVESPVPAPVVVPAPPAAPTHDYVVRSGDSLSKIARAHDTTVSRLVELNGIVDPNLISVGQVLRIDGPATATAPAERIPSTSAPTTPAPGRPGAVPPGPVISRVPGAHGKVAITFDDGPNGATTDAILGVLARHGVPATFFVVGNAAARDGARLGRMHDAGHVIANHSWDHPQLTGLDDAQVRRQLVDTSDAIERATGQRPDIFRPPYGARNDRVDEIARDAGMRDVLWDVDTVDWSRPGTDAIVESAVHDARDGSVILMHDGGGNREQTVAAVERVVTGLQARGFELVTVPQLVAAGA